MSARGLFMTLDVDFIFTALATPDSKELFGVIEDASGQFEMVNPLGKTKLMVELVLVDGVVRMEPVVGEDVVSWLKANQ